MAKVSNPKPRNWVLGEHLGYVIGETSHTQITFTCMRPVHVGEYVLVEYDFDSEPSYALGIVERSAIGNPMISVMSIRPEFVTTVSEFGAERHEYMIGQARILSWLHTLLSRKSELVTPRYPPRPAAKVYSASDEVLKKIFVKPTEDGWVKLGTLVNHPNVPFYVNIPKMVSRHLAILAITGAGKSNTVAVLLSRIVGELRGTALVIDMHSEYGGVVEGRTNLIKPMMHPAKLTLSEYYALLKLDEGATKQRMYLRKAYRELFETGEALRRKDEFLKLLLEKLTTYYDMAGKKSRTGSKHIEVIPVKDQGPILDLIHKLEELMDSYGGTVLTPSAPDRLESVVKPGYANVLDLGSVDEVVADVVTYHYLWWLLNERKKHVVKGDGYPIPVLTVIEEAHVLVPNNRKTLTKGVVARIAREGRKFGVGLALVSQRPKNVDEDALSQTNNKIILKLVEPRDQQYVQRASETLSDELLQLLPSLNTGEAVVLGMMAPLPALVRIDRAERKGTGSDIPVHREWASYWERKEPGNDEPADFYEELGF